MGGTPLGPRVVVAGTHSGVGKTTVATGLMAALRMSGYRVASAKVGPDFIDPGYHALACGRAPRNLDAWLCGVDAIAPLAARAAAGSDILVVEGVMGLFDGAADGVPSSTADIAAMIDAPVVLVVDASAMSESVAALVHGYSTWQGHHRLAGVVLNRVGSAGHEVLLREALEPLGIPVLGALMRDDALQWRDRHLGLVPVAEQPGDVENALRVLAGMVARGVDLEAVAAIARSAPELATGAVPLPAPGSKVRVAVAAGKAFTFTYEDTLDALRSGGAEIVRFDPLTATTLPEDVDGLMIGGGFPEVYAAELAANEALLTDIRRAIAGGLATWAECGGLLLLARGLDGRAMAGVVPAEATMTQSLTLGYRTATTTVDSPVGPSGTTLRGHEFHYSTLEDPGTALTMSSRWGEKREGWATPNLLATYLHFHPGGDPAPVESFLHRLTLRTALHSR